MNAEQLAKALGPFPVEVELCGYTKANGETLDYSLLLGISIADLYHEAVAGLSHLQITSETTSDTGVSLSVLREAKSYLLERWTIKAIEDHDDAVLSSRGEVYYLSGIVLARSANASFRRKDDKVRARQYLKDQFRLGQLRTFRLDRCRRIKIRGKTIQMR